LSPRLECRGLSGGWGAVTVFRDLGLTVEPGTMHAILGPNGAGKTTLMLTLAGLLPAHGGTVAVDGTAVRTGRSTASRRAGVVLVPDNRELFTTLTVEENLRVPAGKDSAGIEAMLELFPQLEARRKLRAGSLSGGEQQMLAMARALIQRPKVLLVDELSMGLAPTVVEHLFGAVRRVANENGCAVLFVEQYVPVALHVADSASIVNRGSIVLSGSAEELASDPDAVEQAYLGRRIGSGGREPTGSGAPMTGEGVSRG
jgi:branched-chain amino acid transport system ATP-binding protein